MYLLYTHEYGFEPFAFHNHGAAVVEALKISRLGAYADTEISLVRITDHSDLMRSDALAVDGVVMNGASL